MKFLVPVDLVPKLRRNIHKATLANARVDFDDRIAAPAAQC